MRVCEVCQHEYHSATAETLRQACGFCGRQACPDCQRNMRASNGILLGAYCVECVPKIEAEFRSVGMEPPEFVQRWWGKRDSVGRPILREETELLGLTVR